MSNIIEYTPQNKIFDMHEVKKEFIECLTKWLKFHFEEKNSFFDKETVILSTVLNPSVKFDCFVEDEQFEKAKDIVRAKMGNVRGETTSVEENGLKSRSTQQDELDMYIAEHRIPEKSLKAIVKYWDDNKNRYPVLYNLSNKYLYLIASSCSSERLFSHASDFLSKKRSRLLPSHLEESCILQSWLTREGISLFDDMTFI